MVISSAATERVVDMTKFFMPVENEINWRSLNCPRRKLATHLAVGPLAQPSIEFEQASLVFEDRRTRKAIRSHILISIHN